MTEFDQEADRADPSIFDERMGPFTNRPELDALAVRMFRQFSRFEYALKASGCLVRRDGKAEANWDRFAADIGKEFDERAKSNPAFDEAVKYLTQHPPKEQHAKDGALQWIEKPADPPAGSTAVLLYVRRVRNNLFHGGKFSHSWIDPDRSTRLIRASLEILHECLEISDRVRNAYES
jgi:hypothetical protein